MKKLVILKGLTTLLYLLSILGLAIGIPFFLIVLFMPEEIPFELNSPVDLHTFLSVMAFFTGLPFLTYALYLFKKVLEQFEENNLFNNDVIKYLNHIGKAIIIGYFIMALPYMIYGSFIDNEITFDVKLSPREAIIVLGAGLFFMVLSEVFSIAKNIKQENDLTI